MNIGARLTWFLPLAKRNSNIYIYVYIYTYMYMSKKYICIGPWSCAAEHGDGLEARHRRSVRAHDSASYIYIYIYTCLGLVSMFYCKILARGAEVCLDSVGPWLPVRGLGSGFFGACGSLRRLKHPQALRAFCRASVSLAPCSLASNKYNHNNNNINK